MSLKNEQDEISGPVHAVQQELKLLCKERSGPVKSNDLDEEDMYESHLKNFNPVCGSPNSTSVSSDDEQEELTVVRGSPCSTPVSSED